MSRRTILLLVAIGVIVFTVVLVRGRLSGEPPPPVAAPAPVQIVRIVVAKRDLALGSFVQGPQDLDWANAPEKPSPPVPAPSDATSPTGDTPPVAAAPKENYLYEGAVKLTDFNGAVVRRAMHAGDPVLQNYIMKSGEGGFMSAVLQPNMRAVSIAVNATSGNAGFVSPGDRVDLIVTHRVRMPSANNSNNSEESIVSDTFAQDVRVVAVDQMLDNPENKAILAKTVTIEVTPRQAEEINVAADLGKISIALRSTSLSEGKTDKPGQDDKSVADDQAAIFTRDRDISESLNSRKEVAAPRVHVLHGDRLESVDFDQDKK